MPGGAAAARLSCLIGGRKDALQYALGANAANGLRRSNADKRRCVEIALAEFGDLSSRQVAIMCGVSNHMVDDARPEDVGKSPTSTRTDTMGRKQPATKPRKPHCELCGGRHDYATKCDGSPAEDPPDPEPTSMGSKQAAIEAEEARFSAYGVDLQEVDAFLVPFWGKNGCRVSAGVSFGAEGFSTRGGFRVNS